MKFKEARSKILANMFQLVRVTEVNTDTFNIDVRDMKYVNFANCYFESVKIGRGQKILLNGAYIGVLTSNAKLQGKFNIVEKQIS